jgi:hypothetical protein
MKPLPADFIPCYRESILTCGKVTLSEEYALRLFDMAASSVTYRRALEQIGQNGTSNANLALQARNALQEESAPSPAPRKRLVGITALRSTARLTAEPV